MDGTGDLHVKPNKSGCENSISHVFHVECRSKKDNDMSVKWGLFGGGNQ
jgi:hypothetical protein